MSEKVKKNQFCRVDDFNPSVKSDEQFQEHWIHKQVVRKTGDSEDDFVIEEKPVLIEKVNIFKQIQEEAKTTDLKELLRQFALTGDESVFNQRQGFYGDVTQIQVSIEDGNPIRTPEQIKAMLPAELQKLSVEQLATMTDEDIISYFAKVRSEIKEEKKVEGKVNE